MAEISRRPYGSVTERVLTALADGCETNEEIRLYTDCGLTRHDVGQVLQHLKRKRIVEYQDGCWWLKRKYI
jgi:hypothetical protein